MHDNVPMCVCVKYVQIYEDIYSYEYMHGQERVYIKIYVWQYMREFILSRSFLN